jgi:ADP-dependent NAD(P)H-hydrate dehydratase
MNRIVTLSRLPDRPVEGHKGLFGRVLIVGGSDSMIGAPVLAGTASLRMGAGLVQLAVPRAILPACLSITPELIGLPLGVGNLKQLIEAAQLADAVVIGPGMGTKPDARRRLLQLIRLDKPMVIDADALNLLAAGNRWPGNFKATAVLTPHPGEMKRLSKLLAANDPALRGRLGLNAVPSDDQSRIDLATRAARSFGQLIVLKGHRTIVAEGEKFYVNRTGDSSLSKAGTGDVLSGIIGTLLAQGMERFGAACAGVWIHGRAGELAGQKLGRRSVLARDVTDALPAAIREYESAV